MSYLPEGAPPKGAATCDVAIGQTIAGVDCSKAKALPPNLMGLTGNTTVTPDEVSIPIRDGSCGLTASVKGQVTRIAGRQEAAPDVVSIADFTVPALSGASIGLDIRCGLTACVGMHLLLPDELYVSEVTSPGGTNDPYRMRFPVAPGRAYRMVIVAKGSQLRCWINGTATGIVSTSVLSSGYVTFSIYNESGPGGAAVDLQRFYVYQPGAAAAN